MAVTVGQWCSVIQGYDNGGIINISPIFFCFLKNSLAGKTKMFGKKDLSVNVLFLFPWSMPFAVFLANLIYSCVAESISVGSKEENEVAAFFVFLQ